MSGLAETQTSPSSETTTMDVSDIEFNEDFDIFDEDQSTLNFESEMSNVTTTTLPTDLIVPPTQRVLMKRSETFNLLQEQIKILQRAVKNYEDSITTIQTSVNQQLDSYANATEYRVNNLLRDQNNKTNHLLLIFREELLETMMETIDITSPSTTVSPTTTTPALTTTTASPTTIAVQPNNTSAIVPATTMATPKTPFTTLPPTNITTTAMTTTAVMPEKLVKLQDLTPTCNPTFDFFKIEHENSCQAVSNCTAGLTGIDCDIDINECYLNSPCGNQGLCVNSFGSFTCDCFAGFDGEFCEADIDECQVSVKQDSKNQTEICHNHGDCLNTFGSFTCNCHPGYSGDHCEILSNECLLPENLNLCGLPNQGLCVNTIIGKQCVCLSGWVMNPDTRKCDIKENVCNGNPCGENGTCTSGINGPVCICKSGWTGKFCDENIDECGSGVGEKFIFSQQADFSKS